MIAIIKICHVVKPMKFCHRFTQSCGGIYIFFFFLPAGKPKRTDFTWSFLQETCLVPQTLNWRTFHQKETSICFDVACQPLVESFQHTAPMLSVESQTLSRKGVDLWRPWHNRHGAANVPRVNMESSSQTSNADRDYRIIQHVMMSVCILNWSEQIPHPTEECSFEFWSRCHMEPVNKTKSFRNSFNRNI